MSQFREQFIPYAKFQSLSFAKKTIKELHLDKNRSIDVVIANDVRSVTQKALFPAFRPHERDIMGKFISTIPVAISCVAQKDAYFGASTDFVGERSGDVRALVALSWDGLDALTFNIHVNDWLCPDLGVPDATHRLALRNETIAAEFIACCFIHGSIQSMMDSGMTWEEISSGVRRISSRKKCDWEIARLLCPIRLLKKSLNDHNLLDLDGLHGCQAWLSSPSKNQAQFLNTWRQEHRVLGETVVAAIKDYMLEDFMERAWTGARSNYLFPIVNEEVIRCAHFDEALTRFWSNAIEWMIEDDLRQTSVKRWKMKVIRKVAVTQYWAKLNCCDWGNNFL